jgi:hypothetical protein
MSRAKTVASEESEERRTRGSYLREKGKRKEKGRRRR